MALSDEQRAKISAKLTGRKLTEEHRRNIGEAQRGVPKSMEHRQNLSEAMYRRHERARAAKEG